MVRLLAFSSAVFVLGYLVFFDKSNVDDHSLFYISGENLHEVLKQDGSFGSAPAFFVINLFKEIKNKINTGEYLIKKGETALSVIEKMFSGNKVTRKLTIPEGYTVKKITKILQDNKLLFGELPNKIEEGSLFPDTYFYRFGDSKTSVLKKMHNQMQKVKSKLFSQNKTDLSNEEIMVLASIIEKESGNKEDSFVISSVFHNRLSQKMRLQSDPTVIYAISKGEGKIDRKLTRQDLFFNSPFNTYRNSGLPPLPICCPGEHSIKAAMFPAKTDYLFFFTTKTGSVFTKNFKDHLKVKKENS